MYCHRCGNQIVEESAFCPKCGEKLIKDGMVQQTPANLVASVAMHDNNNKYCVTLTHAGSRNIEVIKVVRELTGLGLAEAKALVDNVPQALKTGLTKMEAESVKSVLESVGATVVLTISEETERKLHHDDSIKDDKFKQAGCLRTLLRVVLPFLFLAVTAGSLMEYGFSHPISIVGIIVILIGLGLTLIDYIKAKTKNPKRLIMAVAGTVVVAVIAIVIAFSNSGGDKDYIGAVKNGTPSGYSATYGEVFNKYISSIKWESTVRSKDLAFVDIIGTIPTTHNSQQKSDIVITMRITPQEGGRSDDMVWIEVYSLEIYGKTYYDVTAGLTLAYFFSAYDLGYSNIAQYFNDIWLFQ